MISTLLFDLDNTLLDNDMGDFLPAYLQRLAAHLHSFAPPGQIGAHLLNGTRRMLAHRDPSQTLLEAFNQDFYSGLQPSPKALSSAIDAFYREVFPSLETTTGVRPEAREVMEWAFAQGRQVAIATGPLMPRTAIEQRLAWAGVSPSDFDYAHITSMENSHFAKPQPEYYAELLAQLEVRPDEALMVGDDWENDIVPAETAGLVTFWITTHGQRPPDGRARPAAFGTLSDFLHWARDDGCLDSLAPRPGTRRALTAQLIGNLAALSGLLANLDQSEWKYRPAEGEWSPTEVAGHLRDVEAEVHLPRLRRVVEEQEPFVAAADTDPWAIERDYQSQAGPAAARAFADRRQTTADFVRALPDEAWARPARHALFGPTNFSELVTFILEHDRLHHRQVRETLGQLAEGADRPAA